MYKLMVVDDEQIVLDSISFIVSRFMENVIVAETARSGQEAILKAEICRPDIILMDIKMPGINGLEAVNQIKNFDGNVLFIIVSAYEQFEYAKEALNLGVIEYISKPLNRVKVTEAIQSAIEQKEKEKRRRRSELELKEKMAMVLPVLESGFIYSVVFSDDYISELDSYKNILDIGENSGYIMTLEFYEENETDGPSNRIGSSIKGHQSYSFIRDTVKQKYKCIVGSLMLNRIVIYFFCSGEIDEYEQRLEALSIASDIFAKLRENINADLAIGIGKRYTGVQNIFKSYEESIKAIGFNKKSGIYHINDISLEKCVRAEYPRNEEDLLLKKIATGETEVCLAALDRIIQWAESTYAGNFREMQSSLSELAVMLLRVLQDYSIESEPANRYLAEFLSLSGMSDTISWFRNHIRSIADQIRKKRETSRNSIIEYAKDYLQKNYEKNTSLEEISRMVCISPNYFSKLFKDETGKNFIDYLTLLRIEKAKGLLKNGNAYNKEVCFQVGYSDPNYFSRIFKKIVGMTPTDYKARSKS